MTLLPRRRVFSSGAAMRFVFFPLSIFYRIFRVIKTGRLQEGQSYVRGDAPVYQLLEGIIVESQEPKALGLRVWMRMRPGPLKRQTTPSPDFRLDTQPLELFCTS